MLPNNMELEFILAPKEFSPRNRVERKLKETLERVSCEHLEKLIPDVRNGSCNAYVYVLWDFPIEMRNERSRSIGKTFITEEGDIYIIFSVKLFLVEGIDWQEVTKTSRHEPFHAAQERYIYKKGGARFLEYVLHKCFSMGYNNPMEEGAFAYEENPRYRQDFRIFLNI